MTDERGSPRFVSHRPPVSGKPHTEPRTPGWEPHDDSCDCHIGICMKCGCTNEVEAIPRAAARRRASQENNSNTEDNKHDS